MNTSHTNGSNGTTHSSATLPAGRRVVNTVVNSAADYSENSRTLPGDWPTELLIIGAINRTELLRRIDELQAAIQVHPQWRLVDLGCSLNTQLEAGGVRLAIVARDLNDLATKLSTASKQLSADCDRIRDPSGVYFEAHPLLVSGKLAVICPGEGSQYLGMLAELVTHFPEVRETLASVDGTVGPDGDDLKSISRFFVAPSELADADRKRLEEQLGQLDWAMFSVLAADVALLRMISEVGLNADAVGGHSAGELAALAAAGALDPSDDLPSITAALKSQGDAERRSEHADALLLATATSRETLQTLIAEVTPEAVLPGEQPSVFIAMDNCPHQTVLVGLPEPMEKLEAALKARRIFCERLPFSRPYHTPLFEAYMGPLRETFDAVKFRAPTRTLYSCTTAQFFPTDADEMRELALSHWSSPVEFRRMIEQMYADGVRVFVEAGPRGILSAFVQDILRGKDCLAMPADQSRRSALTQWNQLLGQLAVHQAPLDLRINYRYRATQPIDWPTAASRGAPSATVVATPTEVAAAPASAPAPAAQMPMPTPTHVVAPVAATSASGPVMSAAQITNSSPPRTASATGPGTVMQRHFQLMESMLADQQSAMQGFLAAKSRGVVVGNPVVRRPVARVNRSTLRTPLARSTPIQQAPRQQPPAAPARTPAAPQTLQPAAASTHVAQPPHVLPMGGTVIRHEFGSELVIQRRLDLTEDLYANEHTVGGRDISRMHPEQRGLPVMPMTFILEMMAETAAQLVPGHVVIAAKDVQLQKWLAFDEESVSIVEIVAKRIANPNTQNVEVQVNVRDLGRVSDGTKAAGLGVSQGTIVLSETYPVSPRVGKMELTNDRPCTVTLATLYRNLFHGPSFQGVRSLDHFGDEGLEAQIEVLPRGDLFRSIKDPQFLIDPVTVDVGMHPTAGWHLEQPDQAGRMLLPFELKLIEFFCPSPTVGTKFTIQTRVTQANPRQFTHAGDFVKEDGSLWCRLTSVKCWRFYLPFGDCNFNGPKDEYFISKVWPHGMPTAEANDDDAICVILDPTGDISQPGMQEAGARVTLSDREMRLFRDQRMPLDQRSAWLFGRIAIKDGARLLWRKRSGDRLFIADLDVSEDHYGRTTLALRDGTRPAGFPSVSVAPFKTHYVSLASFTPWAGIAVEDVTAHADGLAAWVDAESSALSHLPGTDEERSARGAAAKVALRAALGTALIHSVEQLHIRAADPATGIVRVGLDGNLRDVFPDLVDLEIDVRTVLVDGMAVASTTGPVPGAKR